MFFSRIKVCNKLTAVVKKLKFHSYIITTHFIGLAQFGHNHTLKCFVLDTPYPPSVS